MKEKKCSEFSKENLKIKYEERKKRLLEELKEIDRLLKKYSS